MSVCINYEMMQKFGFIHFRNVKLALIKIGFDSDRSMLIDDIIKII